MTGPTPGLPQPAGTITITINPEAFSYDGKTLTIIIKQKQKITFPPQGINKGHNWHKPIKGTTIEKIMEDAIEEAAKQPPPKPKDDGKIGYKVYWTEDGKPYISRKPRN